MKRKEIPRGVKGLARVRAYTGRALDTIDAHKVQDMKLVDALIDLERATEVLVELLDSQDAMDYCQGRDNDHTKRHQKAI